MKLHSDFVVDNSTQPRSFWCTLGIQIWLVPQLTGIVGMSGTIINCFMCKMYMCVRAFLANICLQQMSQSSLLANYCASLLSLSPFPSPPSPLPLPPPLPLPSSPHTLSCGSKLWHCVLFQVSRLHVRRES